MDGVKVPSYQYTPVKDEVPSRVDILLDIKTFNDDSSRPNLLFVTPSNIISLFQNIVTL